MSPSNSEDKANNLLEKVEIDEKIKNLCNYEQTRYKRKGYGLVVCIIINFLFFYYGRFIIDSLIPEKIEHEGYFQVIFVTLWHEGFFILVNVYFGIIYYIKHPFFEKYKTTSEPWPWEEDKEKFKVQLKKTFKLLALNHFVLLPILMLPNLIWDFAEFNLKKEDFPSMIEVCFQVLLCVLCDDFFFYCSHRALHSKRLYGMIHKIHHEYKHTIALSSEHAHWLEYLFGNLLSSSAFPLLMNKRMHFITYILWITAITMEAADGHSGYDFSWSPHRLVPFNIGAEYHYFHHLTFTGNFASEFYHWDFIFNTVNKHYVKYYNALVKTDLSDYRINVGESANVNPYLKNE